MFSVDDIRREFPVLGREAEGHIHRGVHFLSEEMTEFYEGARARIAGWLGAAEKEEIIFTSGATASLNTVAYAWGDKFVGPGDNIVVSELEHHSNIVPWQLLAERKGAEIRVLPFDDEGALRTDLLPSLIDGRTRAVAVTQASNTLGTRPDLRPVVDVAHAAGAIVVVDGCQGPVTAGSTSGRWTAISMLFPATSSTDLPASACSTASGPCSNPCPRSWGAATWSTG